MSMNRTVSRCAQTRLLHSTRLIQTNDATRIIRFDFSWVALVFMFAHLQIADNSNAMIVLRFYPDHIRLFGGKAGASFLIRCDCYLGNAYYNPKYALICSNIECQMAWHTLLKGDDAVSRRSFSRFCGWVVLSVPLIPQSIVIMSRK